MEQWNIWFDRDLWIAIGIVVVATAAIYTVPVSYTHLRAHET